jgi:recombination protein RecR
MSRLIDELRKLPGIGTKSAQRLAFHVLRSSDEDAHALAEAILVLRQKLQLCSICNNITDVDPCLYCSSPVRDQHLVCVVEEPTNIATIEKTRSYNGVYHVLHGTLSPIGGVGPEQLRIASLLTRLTSTQSPGVEIAEALDQVMAAGANLDPIALNEEILEPEILVREVILATSPTTEGEATAAYLAQEIRRVAPALRVTRIATGIPAGSDIEYADEVTVTRALEGRREF